MGLFPRPDGKTMRLEIENGVGKVWIYDKNGKCIRRPMSDTIARARPQDTNPDSESEKATTEGESVE